MIPTYVAVLKAKAGEFEAIEHLDPNLLHKVLPIFEVVPLGEQQLKAKKRQNSRTRQRDNLDEVVARIAGLRKGQLASVDISSWPANATVEGGEHVLRYLCDALAQAEVRVCPTIGFDRWDDPEYRAAVTGISLPLGCYFLIRIDSLSLEDIKDERYLAEQLNSILSTVATSPRRGAIVVDFGDVTSRAVVDLQEQLIDVILKLKPWGFRFIATIGSSLPSSIDQAVNRPNSSGSILRKELLVWKEVCQASPDTKLVFGDYGVRNPHSSDAPSPHANGKIRYTIRNHFFIARGHSLQLGKKGGQYYALAAKVLGSGHYRGEEYSWGDSQIRSCSEEAFRGTPTTWIAIDTNHHVEEVMEEVAEFERALTLEIAAV